MSVKKLIWNKETQTGKWVSIDEMPRKTQPKHIKGRDPTIDQYLHQHGGIKSPIDRKIYTTKSAYLNHIKAAGKHIHE